MALNAISTQYIFPCLSEQSGWHSLLSNDSKMFWSSLSASSLDFCPQTWRCGQSSHRLTALNPQPQGCCHPPRHKSSGTGTGWLPGISPGIYCIAPDSEISLFFSSSEKLWVFLPVLTQLTDLHLIFTLVCLFHLLGLAPHATPSKQCLPPGKDLRILGGRDDSQPSWGWTSDLPTSLLPHPLPLGFPAHMLLFSAASDSSPCTRGCSTHTCWWYLALCLCAAMTEYFLQKREEITEVFLSKWWVYEIYRDCALLGYIFQVLLFQMVPMHIWFFHLGDALSLMFTWKKADEPREIQCGISGTLWKDFWVQPWTP